MNQQTSNKKGEEKLELNLEDVDFSLSSLNKTKKPCATKLKLKGANDRIEHLEAELLGMKVFLSEVGMYEAWSDNKDNYLVEEK